MTIDTRSLSRFMLPQWRLPQALALGCCVVAFAFVSSATARPDHGHRLQDGQGQGGAGQGSGGSEQGQGASFPEEALASSHPHGVSATGQSGPVAERGHGHGRGASSDGHGVSSLEGDHTRQATGPGSGAVGSDGRGRSSHERNHSREGGGAGGDTGGSDPQGRGSGGAREGGTGTRSSARSSIATQSRVSSFASGSSTRSAQTVAPGASASTSAAPSAPTAIAVPSAVPSNPPVSVAPTTRPSGASATPQVASRSRKGARRAHRHNGSTPTAFSSSTAAGDASGAPLAATPVPVADKTSKGAFRKPASPERLPPLVKTITKIVGVVPAAVRALIGLLIALALALGARSWVAALRARRLDRQRVQLLEDVGLLQAALLPLPPARLGPVATSVAYQPANGPGAGGDFYDVFALEDGRLGVIVGDISGHGRQALPHTALVRFTLRAYLEAGLSPRDAVQTAGAVLDGALGGAFATVVLATYHPRDRLLTYSCAGHPPPVVLGSEALATRTVAGAPPIGVGMRTGTRQTLVSVPGFARVCFHTDGVTEARIASDLFGGERLASTLSELGPRADAKALLDSVASQTDARPDDMAACLLTIAGDAQPPAVLVEQLELDGVEATSDRAERFLLACGVGQGEACEVMRSAASLGGLVQIEAHLDDGAVQVELHRHNVAPLLPRHARAAMSAGASR